MTDSFISDPAIISAITSNNLDNLQRALSKPLDHLLAVAITHNSHLTIPHLISLGENSLSEPVFNALLSPASFPSLLTLIAECAYDVNTNLDRLGTFLIVSIKRNNPAEAQALLAHGANPNLGLYAHLYSLLASAIEFAASLDIIDMLLRAGATMQGSDALQVAAMTRRIDVLCRLLNRGADINEIGFEYAAVERLADIAGTALHFAADNGSEEAIQMLLERGADRQRRDVQGRTALNRARKNECAAIIALLEK